MKKMFMGFVATCVMCILAACGGPKLEGTWVADGKTILGDEAKEFKTAELVMTLDGTNMKMDFNIEMVEEKEMKMEMGFKVSGECPYTADDQAIHGDFAKGKTSAEITKFVVDEEMKKMLEKVGMDEEKFKESFKSEMKPDDMFKDLGAEDLKIKELTDTQLVLTDKSGKDITFTRK